MGEDSGFWAPARLNRGSSFSSPVWEIDGVNLRGLRHCGFAGYFSHLALAQVGRPCAAASSKADGPIAMETDRPVEADFDTMSFPVQPKRNRPTGFLLEPTRGYSTAIVRSID